MRGSRTASSDMSAWCSAVVLLSLILLLSVRENNASNSMRGSQFSEKPCEEIYVVGEGETLHTIGDKCGDPFIVERNPHIHDPDDVFPDGWTGVFWDMDDFTLPPGLDVDQFVKNVCLAISNEGVRGDVEFFAYSSSDTFDYGRYLESKSFTPAKVVSKRSRLMFWKYVRPPFFCDPTTDYDSRSSSPETDRADVLKV
ncbi:hypothetical protein HID58_093587 [Brassica napus]|uniref:LysM domain-containing protein n=1 Tax=Brassica napus TaxID=3708 RepID=A0ABQ7XAI5_BRANA|nr:hypothetical protein HID58_093587 [Brassica napus]